MIYLASPYTHREPMIMQHRYEQVLKCLFWMTTTRPVPVYSPIVHFHDLADKYDLPRDANWWKATNFNMIRKVDTLAVLVIEGTTESKGVQEEIEFARYLMMPVEYVDLQGHSVAEPAEFMESDDGNN